MKVVKPSFEILTTITGNELVEIERAARTCYKSEDRITEGSAETLVKSLITRGHEAMLEFSHLQVRFICDRGISHELVRHRLCNFAQESSRYVDYGKAGEIQVIIPEEIRKLSELTFSDIEQPTDEELIYLNWENAMLVAEEHYNNLRKLGVQPQIARSVLPTCVKTEIVVQANYREFRHILRLRTAVAAHPDMRVLMIPLLKELKEKIPIIFDDIMV